jgi:hypothetical protein
MASTNLLIGAITDTDTVQRSPLGLLYEEPTGFGSDRDPAAGVQLVDRGQRIWIYVQAAATLAQGTVCVPNAGEERYIVRLSTFAAPQNSSQVVGVAQHAIAASSFGWILRVGLGEVLADTGGITADIGIQVGNAVDGRADFAAATAPAFGWSTETVAATALATCRLNCVG